MKKILMFLALIVISLGAFAATDEAPLVIDFSAYFVSFAALAGIVPVVTQIVLKYINTKYDQYFSWLVAVGLAALGYVFQFGIFAGANWYWIFIYGIAAGLAANGIFNIPLIQALLNLIVKKKYAIKESS